jgi:hypothetical protein
VKFSRLLPLFVGVLSWLAFVAPALDPSVALYYRDTGRLYYPVKRYLAERLSRGELPLWDPWTESGTSLLGQTTPALFHPLTLLYVALPFDIAFKLNHLLPLLAAGMAAWLLARQLGASRWAAVAGGAVYAGSGYLVAQSAANLPYAVGGATVPLAIALFLRYLDKPTAVRLLWAALALGSCELAGEPESMLFAGLLGAAYALARDLFGAQPEARWPRASRTALRTAAWGASALLLAAPAAAPSIAALVRSPRLSGPTAQERDMFYVMPARLSGLLVPKAFDDKPEDFGPAGRRAYKLIPYEEYFACETTAFADSMFLGPAALLLAAWAIRAGRRGRFLLLGGAVLLLATTGPAFGVYELLLRLVPPLRFFRYAEKLLAPATLLLALCAALGADAAFSSKRRALLLAAQAGALAAALWGGSALLAGRHENLLRWLTEHGQQHIQALAPVFVQLLREGLLSAALLAAPLAICAALCALRPLLLAAGPALAALSCLAAPFAATMELVHIAPAEMLHQPPVLADELVARAGPSPGRWRLYVDPRRVPLLPAFDDRTGQMLGTRAMLQPQFDSLFGIEGAAQYFSAVDQLYEIGLYRAIEPVFLVLRVRFALYGLWEMSAQEAHRRSMRRLASRFWAAEFPLQPEASLIARTFVVGDADDAIAKMKESSFKARREAVLLQGPDARALDAGPFPSGQGSLSLHRFSPEHARIEVDAPHEGFLITATHFDPGWRATIDGAPAPLLRADLVVNGLFVPAGKHLVELIYWPPGFTAGLVGFLSVLVGFSALFILDRRRQNASSP